MKNKFRSLLDKYNLISDTQEVQEAETQEAQEVETHEVETQEAQEAETQEAQEEETQETQEDQEEKAEFPDDSQKNELDAEKSDVSSEDSPPQMPPFCDSDSDEELDDPLINYQLDLLDEFYDMLVYIWRHTVDLGRNVYNFFFKM